MTFSATGLPDGLSLDPESGRITGKLGSAGEFKVHFQAKNGRGKDEREFRIVVGDKISLNKMHLTAPQVVQRYGDNLKKLVDEASGDAEKLEELKSYTKVNDELSSLTADLAKEVAGEGK